MSKSNMTIDGTNKIKKYLSTSKFGLIAKYIVHSEDFPADKDNDFPTTFMILENKRYK